MNINKKLNSIFENAEKKALEQGLQFVTPELFILTLTCYKSIKEVYTEKLGGNLVQLKKDLKSYIDTYVPHLDNIVREPLFSAMLIDAFENACKFSQTANDKEVNISHVLTIILGYFDCFATYYLVKNCNADEKTIVDEFSLALNCTPCKSIEEVGEKNILAMIAEDINANNDIQNMLGCSDWKELVICLNDEVEKENYTPLIGRQQEIEDTIEVLLRKTKNNPIHTGEAGVGKTAIVEGLAKRINEGNVPEQLKGYKIYSCSMGSLVAGSFMRGAFEEKLKCIIEGISNEKAILYIDEIHTIVGAGGQGSSDASNILKPYLTTGKIKVIGATTNSEYRKTIEKDAALERRFYPIDIKEPSQKETFEILLGIKASYEDYHKCLYSEEILQAIIKLTAKYVNDRFFPDKAIDVMDEAGAYISMHELKNRNVTFDIIENIIAKKCNIPRESVSSDEIKKIEKLSKNMKNVIIGQDEAVSKIQESIILSRAGLREDNKPVANLFFVGATGVGKTYIAQTLSKELGIPLIRKDMSEFSEAHSISKLFGSPAGYVGYDEGGLLINEIRKNPHCILLLDEIEKAHPDVHNVLLQIMDNAKLTDSFGKSADFRNVILIMTSNTGAEEAEKRGIGFNQNNDAQNTGAVDKQMMLAFRPEFRNRLDAIIHFNKITEDVATNIAKNQMKELSKTLKEKNVELTYKNDIIKYIVEKGFSETMGARNIKRTIDSEIKIKLGNELLFGKLKNGGKCVLSVKDGKVIIS